jgi:hypothetical protein
MRRPLLTRAVAPINVLVGIVVIAVLVLIVFWFMGKIGTVASTAQSDQACETSVAAQALAGAIRKTDAVQLQCTTNYRTIDAATPDAQKKAIADAMASCWRRYHQGKLKIFAVETGKYCVVCDRLTFTKPQEIKGLTKYLYTTRMAAGTRTYAEYLMNMEGTAPVMDAYATATPVSLSAETIDTRTPLAVLFVADKNVKSAKDYAVSIGAGVGATLLIVSGVGAPAGIVAWGALLGTGAAVATTTHYAVGPYFKDQEWKARVDLVPYDRIVDAEQGCNRLEGRAGPLEYIS